MLTVLEENIKSVLKSADENSLDGINARLEELQKELLKLANAHKDYGKIADEIERLRDKKQDALVESAEKEGLKLRIAEMKIFLKEQSDKIDEYDEGLVRRIIEKITVYDEYLTVEFKSGISVDIRR